MCSGARAAGEGLRATGRLLLAGGLDPCARDAFGLLPAHVAADRGHDGVVDVRVCARDGSRLLILLLFKLLLLQYLLLLLKFLLKEYLLLLLLLLLL